MCGKMKILVSIALLTIFLTLDHVAPYEVKCLDSKIPVRGIYHVCNVTDSQPSFTACCYNDDLNYHYCCSKSEFKSMTRGKRVGGALAASAIILLLICLLCALSNRCPLRRAVTRRRAAEGQASPADVVHP